MKRDDGFPSSWTALHNHDSMLRRSDDLILFGLNGRDDVAKLSGMPT